jgi:DNA-directed RNA polymerase subunit M/transcription elongation factor TFIIS
MDFHANKYLLDTMQQQATFLDQYFSGTSVPLDEQRSRSARVALPLLDYLYDKQLQLDMDTRGLLTDHEYDLACSTERFVEDVENSMSDQSHHVGAMTDRQIKDFRTLYRFRIDNKLQNHANHYQQSFLPFYRFSRNKNFSQAVGNTMKRNIRLLYDHVRKLVGNPDVCPCIVLYNLFIRDNFRLFSLVSMQHFNYVRLYDDQTNEEKIISYVELTNVFPQISQWFPNINSQYVKKYGPHAFHKLRFYVSLMVSAADEEHTVSYNRHGAVRASNDSRKTACIKAESSATGASTSNPIKESSSFDVFKKWRKSKINKPTAVSQGSRVLKKQQRNYSGGKRVRLEQLFLQCRGGGTSDFTSTIHSSDPSTTSEPHSRDSNDRRVEHSAGARPYGNSGNGNGALLLDKLFRSNYVDCKHTNVIRFYVQLRSGDESGTLILRCALCGKRL